MIARAEARGEIRPGDTLIEATSGNTGIALAMAAAIKGYRMVLIMPDNLSVERRQTMKAFGAELVLVTQRAQGMEHARDLADADAGRGQGARYSTSFPTTTTGRRISRPPGRRSGRTPAGQVTHFVSAMGTTGTITGVSRLSEGAQNPQSADHRRPAR